ncbi:2-polyprenyl-6-methoxyphenol hydroxylase-like oxidoreductase [Mycobacterium sp.]|jgi:2-polyprenyl-6-methoxyphenol hydroxylase-like FAD-dependent oxidoreductase|uniref:FAD-dependent oxidoreductase n=1 Tax=Mycobacterium sp. TaxID=1785 RepID=UPI002BAAA34A|nr:2-polyprenyl-6-methoxyphenol hydroxylase-like oxidoreductase [Mycobacterium sp.]HXB89865.1 2-polyprenyl-6-methoxyphenol hydroxylase-like oxidoreductase [Mycobacterium sp.]
MAGLGERAVVLGASMGGLLAARVLAEFFGTVTVVERDVLPDDPAVRRGVPQGRHVHVLLARGAQILDELFPGFLNELVADGAPVWDDGELSDLHLSFGGHEILRSGQIAREPKALAVYMPSRPFLECHVRRRLEAMSNVTILSGHDVSELTSTPDRGRVTGVRVVNRDGGAERELRADVVMDAMGRGAHTPAFLESLGYGRPIEDHIVMHTNYVSQLLRIPPGTLKQMLVDIGPAPDRPTGMFLTGYENDTWMFTVFGMVGHQPPRDLAGMLSFAREYCPAHLIAAIRAAEPIGEVAHHHMPSSQWRRYDKMLQLPDGLLVCGDAICSFNPIYGQGMTVAALEAATLRKCLRDGGTHLPRRYFRASAKPIGVAWQMAACSDLTFPEVAGRRSRWMGVTTRLLDWALTACESDLVVAVRFFKVNGLIYSPLRLLHPVFVYRVAVVNLRRRRGDGQFPRPKSPTEPARA